jgi:N4-gp56 family major capsid protein
MAATDYPLNHPLAVKRWAKGLMKEALKKTYFLQFAGGDSNSLVQIKTELNKAEGDRIRFGLRAQLTGDGIQGDNIAEGNEEALETYYQDVFIDQLRHSVRSKGKMSEQRVPFNVRDEARDGLSDWWANRYDAWFFNVITGNTSVTDIRYTGMQAAVAPDADHLVTCASTSGNNLEASISATSVATFSLSVIDKAVEIAKTAKNALRPLRVDSDEYLVAFLHPYQVTALRTNTNTGQWLDIQKAALGGNGSRSNPIFTGALGMYNNVILKESTRVPLITTTQVTATGTSGVARAVLCGAQTAMLAFGRGSGLNTMSWVEELFDYKNSLGVLAGSIGGMVKSRFNGSDFATVVMSTYAAKSTS